MTNHAEIQCPVCGAVLGTEGLCAACLLRQAALDTHDTGPATVAEISAKPPTVESVAAAFPQLEILELIGRGGMGTVFKVRQPKLNRLVALKILTPHLVGTPASTFADRFLREAQLLARLSHPNIVTVHDFGQSGGFYYLMMEFVDGVNLRQAIRSEHFTPEQTLSIVPKICEALQYAHEEGVLHRDIKPENILLDTKGRIKIADFGIASFKSATTDRSSLDGEDAGERLTQTGQILGTPNYMAPEQIERPSEVDHRADIYSLGVVFYELLTGELPLGRFPLPSEKTPVDASVDEIVLKALEKDRERRQQSAAEFRTEVETSRQVSSESKAKKDFSPKRFLMKKHPMSLAFLLVVGMVAGMVSTPIIRNLDESTARILIVSTVIGIAVGSLGGILFRKNLRKLFGLPVDNESSSSPSNPLGNKSAAEVKTWPPWATILILAVAFVFVIRQIIFFFQGEADMGHLFASSSESLALFVPLAPFVMLAFIATVVVVGVVIVILAKKRDGVSMPQHVPIPSSSPTLFCTNCGNKLDGDVYACPRCGFPPRAKRNFCYHCGIETDPEQIMCIQCGHSLTLPTSITWIGGRKDRLATALFALLLGWLGIHKFYLGSWGWGLVFLLFSWTGITFIIGIIEGILFLTMDEQTFDVRYNQTQPSPFRW